MTADNPITLDDIIKMDNLDENENTSANTLTKIADTPPKTKPLPTKSADTSNLDNSSDSLKLKESQEKILVEIKTVAEDIKIKENNQQRVFERTCTDCHHIFFSDIPLKYFYVDGKKGDNYKVIKLPTDQYPADLPKDILEMIESHKCPKCRK